MRNKAFFLFILFFFCNQVIAQTTNWKNYTDMKDVRSVAFSGSELWAATTGGAFVYNPADDSYRKFHKADGFSGTQLTSTAVDNNGRIWFGSSTGRIDIYDPQTKTFTAVLDIFNSLKQHKGINSISVFGDSVFVTTDFGISVINASTLIFIDTYSRFATLGSDLKVYNILKLDRIYAAVDNGLVVQKAGAINLSSPDSWNLYPVIVSGSARKVKQVIEFNGSVIVGTEYGVFIFDGTAFSPFFMQGQDIRQLKVADNFLYVSSGFSLYRFNGQIPQQIISGRIFNDVFSQGGTFYAASDDGVLVIAGDQITKVIKPDAPFANLFAALVIDSRGYLWSASARDPGGKGFYMLNNNGWTNYNLFTNPEIKTDAYFNAYTSGEEVYLGSWGGGFLRIRDGVLNNFSRYNSPLRGVTNNPDYVVIGGLGKDSRNNLWILNYGTVTRENLSMLTPDSTWYNFIVGGMQNLYLDENFGLVIDQYDTKWFFSRSTSRSGVFYFNENSTLDNTADDRSGFISELNDKVLSMAVDRRGDIWIGTGLGVNVITNPSAAVSVSNPQFRPSSVFALRQYSINAIAVDPLNRKWIGTNQGLLLVNSDGSALLESYDSRNSALLSDDIRSVVVDEQTGTVYAGTDAGLTSFETYAKRPLESFDELIVYPNPLKISSSFKGAVTIDGLIKDADIKILNINGKLINEFSSPGGRVAFWDGKNQEGEFVNSGVYIIVASDKEGDNVKTAKVAVLKE